MVCVQLVPIGDVITSVDPSRLAEKRTLLVCILPSLEKLLRLSNLCMSEGCVSRSCCQNPPHPGYTHNHCIKVGVCHWNCCLICTTALTGNIHTQLILILFFSESCFSSTVGYYVKNRQDSFLQYHYFFILFLTQLELDSYKCVALSL